MVLDNLTNFYLYSPLHKSFDLISEFFKHKNVNDLAPGIYELSDNSFVMINTYMTKDVSECFIECHKKFIDVQVILSGCEKIGIINKQECSENSYDEEKDFQKLVGEVDYITLKEGYFAIFFPHDGHMPQVKINHNPGEVKKAVFKISV